VNYQTYKRNAIPTRWSLWHAN